MSFFPGRSWGTKGPGLIYLPPLFAKMQKVSLRVVALDIPPQDVIQTVTGIASETNSTTIFPVPLELLKAFLPIPRSEPPPNALPERTTGDALPAPRSDEKARP